MLINKLEGVVQKCFDEPKAVIEYQNDRDDIYENINESNLNTKCKILIVFHDMIADMFSNKKL